MMYLYSFASDNCVALIRYIVYQRDKVYKNLSLYLNMKERVKALRKSLPPHNYHSKRWSTLTLAVIILGMIYFFRDEGFLLRAVSAASFILFFYAVDHWFDVRFKPIHYAFIVIIAIASLLLSPLYYIYPQYDKIQHFAQPILLCSIIYHMVSHIRLEMKWRLIFTFFIVISILGLFEMAEYTLDQVFDWNLQGVYLRDITGLNKFDVVVEPIDDTMIDLFFGVAGTCIYGLAVFLYLRHSRRLVFRN